MKLITRLGVITVLMALFFTACKKVEDLPFYGKGTAPVLSASTTTVAPVPTDSLKTALKLSWTSPGYKTDTSNYKFVVQIDSAGKNFANPFTKVVMGKDSVSLTAKEINTFLLSKGYAFNKAVDMDVRVLSSYGNNNEQYATNTIKMKMTPYKVPPKVELPSTGRLFITGGDFGWKNDNPMPGIQELTRISETEYGGIFEFKGGESYLLLGVAGSWDEKFGTVGSNNSNKEEGGDFKKGGGDMKSPAEPGFYKVIFDFQTGTFTVTKFDQQHGMPQSLFIVGSATAGDWTNPVPVPDQEFTRISSSQLELTLPLIGGKEYLLLPENGNWDKKFGSSGDATNTKLVGTFKPQGNNFQGPDVDGTYKITVDFLNNSYKLVKQ